MFAMPAIVDTHVHIWDFSKARYPWLDGDTSLLNRVYALSELEPQRIAAGITDGVLVQAANHLDDTTWMLHNARAADWIRGVVGWVPLVDPSATAALLDGKFAAEPLLKGIRHLIHNEPDPRWLLQEPVLESLQLLAQRGLAYDVVGIHAEHLHTALAVAAKLPELRMVFDHLNQPPMQDKRRWSEWVGLMQEAAQHPNFYAKISGLGTASGNPQGWTAATIKPAVAIALETFGADRCFCGGDWPVSLLAGSYVDTWQAYRLVLEDLLEPKQEEAVLATNAVKFYCL